eukprot:scaffold58854_cov72-Phaeocystis_antarctica.AAC.3
MRRPTPHRRRSAAAARWCQRVRTRGRAAPRGRAVAPCSLPRRMARRRSAPSFARVVCKPALAAGC